jgi:tRNA(fMet)-specific endonuclease VapC
LAARLLGVPDVVAFALRFALMRLPQEAAEPRLGALAQFPRPLQMLPFDDEGALRATKIHIALSFT